MTVKDFAEKYNLPEKLVYSYGKAGQIDEKYYIRRYKFKLKVMNEIQERYYFLNSKLKDIEIARLLAMADGNTRQSNLNSWSRFIRIHLFTEQPENILDYRITDMQYRAYRYFSWIVNILYRQCSIPRNKRR